MQYRHTLEYGDGESITLERAIAFYKDFLEEELKDGAKCPYSADLYSIKILERKVAPCEFFKQRVERDMYFSLEDLSKMAEDGVFTKYTEHKENTLLFKDWYLDVHLKNRKL